MNEADIVETLRNKLSVPVGRHLYAVLGAYPALDSFARTLQKARMPDNRFFPAPISITGGVLETIPDDEFKKLVRDEIIYPEPTAANIRRAFDRFLRERLSGRGLLVLNELELLFAYNIELQVLRTQASDGDRVLLLLPGRRESGQIRLFPDSDQGSFTLPSTLIADNHLWELTG